MHALFQNSGSPAVLANYREIILGDPDNEDQGAHLRTVTLPATHLSTSDTQFGSGLNGGGCDVPHLIAATITQYADVRSLSSALLFIDVKSAFASVQRSTVLTVDDGDEEWAKFLSTCGFDNVSARRIITNACRIGTLIQNGLLEYAAALLSELHINTWFGVEAVQGIIRTTKGTIAGHPPADLIHALADAEVDDYFHGQLVANDLVANLPTGGISDRWGCDAALMDTAPLHLLVRRPAYCDDAIVAIIALAMFLVEKVALAASLAQEAYARFGMIINFKPGKTESVLRFRGLGSEIARRSAMVVNDSICHCSLLIGMPFILRFVSKYKHLGGWLNAANNFVGELAYRGALMTQAMHPIKKKFLHVEDIPMREKKPCSWSTRFVKRVAHGWHLAYIEFW